MVVDLVRKKFETNWNEIREYRMNVMTPKPILWSIVQRFYGRKTPIIEVDSEEVEYEILIYQYNGGSASVFIVEDIFIDLITKFKYGPPGIRHHGRFDGTRAHTIWYN